MKIGATIPGLLQADAQNVTRDPMLMAGVVMSILPIILLLAFGDAARAASLAAFGYPRMDILLGSLAVLMPGAMLGWVTGFLLLEDRDDAILMALDVTPLGKLGFIAYRLSVMAGLAFILALVAALATLPALPAATALGLALLTTGHGLITTLFLLAFAGNKVEGLALTKLINLGLLAPLLALVPAPWRYLASPIPPFWIGEALALGAPGVHPALCIVAGVLASAGIGFLLWQKVHARLG